MTTTATPVRRSTGVPRWLRRLSGPVLILLAWWLVTATGLISTRSLPTPGAVFDGFVDLTKNGELPEAFLPPQPEVVAGPVPRIIEQGEEDPGIFDTRESA